MSLLSLICLVILGSFVSSCNAGAAAVVSGTNIDKTPLYADADGGLSAATQLTGVLPGHSFVLTEQLDVPAAGRCFGHQDTDECATVNSTWSVYQATWKTQPDTPVFVCICQGTPFEAESFVRTFAHVSCCPLLIVHKSPGSCQLHNLWTSNLCKLRTSNTLQQVLAFA